MKDDSSIFNFCVRMIEDDEIQLEMKKIIIPIINLIMENMWPYIYLFFFILTFIILCSIITLILCVRIFYKII